MSDWTRAARAQLQTNERTLVQGRGVVITSSICTVSLAVVGIYCLSLLVFMHDIGLLRRLSLWAVFVASAYFVRRAVLTLRHLRRSLRSLRRNTDLLLRQIEDVEAAES